MKRFLLLLSFLLIGIVQTFAHDFEVDGIYYNILSGTTNVEVTRNDNHNNSYSGSVTIPSSVSYGGTTYSVTSIGYYAFSGCSGLTSVVIPSSVTSIVNYAFSGCSGLTSVVIPSSVTSIGGYAFSGGDGLTSVVIPSSVTSIGQAAFCGCSGLTSISVDAANTVYDSRNNCNAIIKKSNNQLVAGCKNTVIPSSVTSIGQSAFWACSGLTSVVIPSSVTSIGDYAFRACSGLTSVVIPSSVTSIGSSAFYGCSGLTSVVIPSSVTSIGSEAFYGCSGLTSVVIPSSVTSIGSDAFSGCSGLASVTMLCSPPSNFQSASIRSAAAIYVTRANYDAYTALGLSNRIEVFDDNILYLDEQELQAGTDATLSLKLKNNVDITSLQFDLVLPKGITIPNGSNGKPNIEVSTNRTTTSKHKVNCNQQEDGSLRVICTSFNNDTFSGNDGEVLKIHVNVAAAVTVGLHDIRLKNMELGEPNNTPHEVAEVMYPITVTPASCTITVTTFGTNHIIDLSTGKPVENLNVFENLDVDGLVTSPEQITSNAAETTEGPIENLVDGDFGTFFHSAWSADAGGQIEKIKVEDPETGEITEEYPEHNLMMDLNGSYQQLTFKWFTRQNTINGRPVDVTIFASNDGENWTEICKDTFFYYGTKVVVAGEQKNSYVGVLSVDLGAKYGHVRIDVKNDGMNNGRYGRWMNASEFRVYEGLQYEYKYDEGNSPGTVSGGGTYTRGTSVTLTATPADGYEFLWWSNGTRTNPYTFTATANMSVTAQFQAKSYTITATSADAEQGTVIGGGTYTHGTSVTLTATPADGYEFVQWSDGTTANPYTFTATADKSVTAQFQAKSYTITATSADTNQGSVTGGGTYTHGATVTLTATPKTGYEFVQWSDGTTANPYTFTAAANKSVTALFQVAAMLGDVNLDTKITAADMVGAVNFIFNTNTTGLSRAAADVNRDGDVTVADATGIVNLALGLPLDGNSSRRRMPTNGGDDAYLAIDAFRLAPGADAFVPVALCAEADEFTALQFDVLLSEGIRLTDVLCDDDHMAAFAQQADGKMRIVVLSPDNVPFAGNGLEALTLQLAADTDANPGIVTVDSIEVARPDMSRVAPAAFSAAFGFAGPTGIDSVESTDNTPLYDIQGRRTAGAGHGIYVTQGRKVVK